MRLANFVTGGDCAAIQDTVQLAKLAYRRFEVNDPLGWDVLNTLELLACLFKQLGCSIYFTGSDLTKGQLSNRLCKAVDGSIFHWSRAGHTGRLRCTQGIRKAESDCSVNPSAAALSTYGSSDHRDVHLEVVYDR